MRDALAHNRREYCHYAKKSDGRCHLCPLYDIENIRGHHSKWGKKKAHLRFYRTGQGAKKPKRYHAYTWYQHRGNYNYDCITV